MYDNVGILYFSGTGNTKYVANHLKAEFEARSAKVRLVDITSISPSEFNADEYDLIAIGYPMHAFNPIKYAANFVKKLPKIGAPKPVFIFQVTGGYEKPSNEIVKKRLKRKGYNIIYEELFVMPSNMVIYLSARETVRRCYDMEKTATKAVSDIFDGDISLANIPLWLKFVYFINRGEYWSIKLIGKLLISDKNKCTMCMKCVNNCPAGNISSDGKNIKFGWKCIFCMKCIYSCPTRAITLRGISKLILDEDFNIEKKLEKARNQE